MTFHMEIIEDAGYTIPVLYEDNHIIAVNKPGGVLVQADKTGDKPLVDILKDYIKARDEKPGNVFIGCVHRLDRPVSGVILFAKTSKALDRMSEQFKYRKVSKTYWALVRERPPQEAGHLEHWLVKDHENNIVTTHEEEVPGGMFSVLDYRVIGHVGIYYLVEVSPVTGRPHQIRVQLASLGCPIRGDKKYGYPKGNKNGHINLHALRLQFTHPVKKEPVAINAPLPEGELWKQFRASLPGEI